MPYLLPNVRSASYENFFNVSPSSLEMEGCYAWCRFISSNLFLIIGDFEVILRNQIHKAFSLYQSDGRDENKDWLIDSATVNHIFDEYQAYRKPNLSTIKRSAAGLIQTLPFLDIKSKSMAIDCVIDFVKKNKKKPSLDDIIAGMNFGFWVQCLYNLTRETDDLTNILSKLFTHDTEVFDLNFLKKHLDTIFKVKNIRNRISHQDSILRTPEANYPHEEFIPRTPAHLINSLLKLLSSIDILVLFLDSQQHTNLKTTPYWNLLKIILDINILETFKKSGGCYTAFLMPVLLNQLNSQCNL